MGWFLFHSSSFIWETRKNITTYFGVQKDSMHKALKQGLPNCDIKWVWVQFNISYQGKYFRLGTKNTSHFLCKIVTLWMWTQHWEMAGWLAGIWHWRLVSCHKIQLESIVIPFTVCLCNSTHLTFKHLITVNSQIKHFISPFCHFSFFMEVNPTPTETQLLHVYAAPTLYTSWHLWVYSGHKSLKTTHWFTYTLV